MQQDRTRLNTYSNDEYYVTDEEMNHCVREFTQSSRSWPGYPADKLEVMARHRGLIPANAHYNRFDVVQNLVIFSSPPPEYSGDVYRDERIIYPLNPIKRWWKKWRLKRHIRRIQKRFGKEF